MLVIFSVSNSNHFVFCGEFAQKPFYGKVLTHFSLFFLKKALVLLCDNPILGKEIESCNNIHANKNIVCTLK